MVELSDRHIKITEEKRMLEDLMVKVGNMYKQMGIFSRVKGALPRNEMEILEMKTVMLEVKTGLTHGLNSFFPCQKIGSVNMEPCQWHIPM